MQPLGTKCRIQLNGLSADAVKGYIHKDSKSALSFCSRSGLGKTSRYGILVFTEQGAGIMARAWASKMQWLFVHDRGIASTGMWEEPAKFIIFASDSHQTQI